MEQKDNPKRKVTIFNGPIVLSTGNAPGGSASVAFSIEEKSINSQETENAAVTFNSALDVENKNNKTSHVLVDMESCLKYARGLIAELSAAEKKDRGTVNHKFDDVISNAKKVISFFISEKNKQHFKEIGISNPYTCFKEFEKKLPVDESRLLNEMLNVRVTGQHTNIVKPTRHTSFQLSEVINKGGVEDASFLSTPKIISQEFKQNGEEIKERCMRYIKILEKFIVYIHTLLKK